MGPWIQKRAGTEDLEINVLQQFKYFLPVNDCYEDSWEYIWQFMVLTRLKD